MEIDAINEVLKLNLPHGEYETLAGFLLQQFDRIPEEGDELYYANLKFVVRREHVKPRDPVGPGLNRQVSWEDPAAFDPAHGPAMLGQGDPPLCSRPLWLLMMSRLPGA